VLGGAPADVRSDIYALFASLFETLAGHRPYRELDVRALRAAAERGRPDWPAHVPAAVRRVVEAGLHPAPARRIGDATDARRELLAVIAPRRRWPIAALAAVACVAIVVIAVRSPHRGGACDVAPRPWRQQLTGRAPLVRARLDRYAEELDRAQAAACNAGGTANERACLERLDQRAAALVAEGGLDVDVERALFELPAPASCASSPAADPETPAEIAVIASARAALARRDARRALSLLGTLDTAEAALVRGRAELDLREHAAAAAAWRRAAERAATAGRDDLVAEANNGLAATIGVGEDQWAAGESYALSARTAALRIGDRVRAGVARRLIGWLAFIQGEVPRAERELTGAADELRAAEAPLDASIAEVYLSRIATERGDLASARAHVERAFVLRRDALGPDHPDTIELESDRAMIDSADGHADRAIERMRREISRLEAVYGTDHLSLAEAWSQLAVALGAIGDYRGADAAMSRTLAIDRVYFGELSRDTGRDYANLARVRVMEARVSEAIELYRSALAAIRSVTGNDHPDLAWVYDGLAVALGTADRYSEAADAEGHAIELWRAHPGHDEDLARGLGSRALVELGLSQVTAARRDAEDALATLVRLHGDDHVAIVPALFALGQAELAGGHLDAARAAVEHVLALHARAGARPRLFVEERWVLGQILWRQGHHAEGLDATRRALAELGDDDRGLADKMRAWLRAPS
jgi:tetratricopeptide (TPR) repeat protein